MQIFADKKFTNPVGIIKAFDNDGFFEAFSQIENLRKRPNNYLVGYIRYEAKEIFLGKQVESQMPLLYFEVFENYEKFKISQKKLNVNISPVSLIDYNTYRKAIEKIKGEIASGNTYQVNYTYDYKIETTIDGFELYQNILPRQKTPYNAYIQNEWEEILSFSPELFFELENNIIRTKPMKGTVKRGLNKKEDRANVEFLKNDIKNRAENVMIVDLIRNDLGKIAKTGTVNVDKLFEVETHKTVHQMTSEISAELEDNATLLNIFNAIYPCGSVTGTPKINTMKIIDELEVGKRNVYCGAIGLISQEKTVFSVPIRILQKKRDEKFYLYRVGGAIVWDSTAQDEWEETLTKIKFLTNDFKLVETMLVEKGNIKYKTAHLNRLKKSAKDLGFKFKLDSLNLNPAKDGILRILMSKDGSLEIQHSPLNTIKTHKVGISKAPVDSKEQFLRHKTTYRPWYDESLEKIRKGEFFDEIFFNEKGELTEGARSNILLQSDGNLFTPPVDCGLLNGVLRQKMLDEGKIKEKKLYLEDLKKAQKVFCINSVRGIVEVKVDFN